MNKRRYFLRCRITTPSGNVSTVELRVQAHSETEAIREAETHFGRNNDVEVLVLRRD